MEGRTREGKIGDGRDEKREWMMDVYSWRHRGTTVNIIMGVFERKTEFC